VGRAGSSQIIFITLSIYLTNEEIQGKISAGGAEMSLANQNRAHFDVDISCFLHATSTGWLIL
jgi:hypothetical protein